MFKRPLGLAGTLENLEDSGGDVDGIFNHSMSFILFTVMLAHPAGLFLVLFRKTYVDPGRHF